jgi:hypothetical protein
VYAAHTSYGLACSEGRSVCRSQLFAQLVPEGMCRDTERFTPNAGGHVQCGSGAGVAWPHHAIWIPETQTNI